VLKFGVDSFCGRLVKAGADGILVVDLPIEESKELEAVARDYGLDIVRLVAPSTPDSRIDLILSRSSGFVYAVSVAGTTGARDVLPQSAELLLKRVVQKSPLPVALGFGISGPQQVRSALEAGASGVVVGSKIISVYSDGLRARGETLAKVERFAKDMKAATLGVKGR
jgi:tryptophan synthase alpha chain